jgi:hypothetical protein
VYLLRCVWAIALLCACSETVNQPAIVDDAALSEPSAPTMQTLRDGGRAEPPGVGDPTIERSLDASVVSLVSDGGGRAPGAQDSALSTSRDAAAFASEHCSASASDGAVCTEGTRESADLCERMAARAGFRLRDDVAVPWARLLCEAVDLDRFTRAPVRVERALLASSYDRKATAEGQPGWFANVDHTHYLREDGDERVLMESRGPGVITRLWSPTPSGVLRIYIDDPDVPAIEAPMLDLLSGELELPWGKPFVFEDAEGYSAYLPIPFARYARVATTTTQNLYYQVEYREYGPGTQVEPYSLAGLRELAPLAAQLAALLDDPSRLLPAALEEVGLSLRDQAPAEAQVLGPAVVRELSIQGAPRDEAWLRNTRLILTVDGERTVDVPLGDLFGGGPGHFAHASLAVTRTDDALVLRWPMPVARELSARVESNGGAIGELTLRLRYTRGVPEGHRLFHALWTGPRKFNTGSALDWTLLHAHGSGWYVGTVLNVANPSVAWWGEGDEKIFVDGETFPSHFGTGTEDYFGYGWCSNERFARPWVGQTRSDGPLSWGRSSLYRWHVGDAIAFQEQLRFALEVLHWSAGVAAVDVVQDAISYWYAAPGATSEHADVATQSFHIPAIGSAAPPLPKGPYACRLP